MQHNGHRLSSHPSEDDDSILSDLKGSGPDPPSSEILSDIEKVNRLSSHIYLPLLDLVLSLLREKFSPNR